LLHFFLVHHHSTTTTQEIPNSTSPFDVNFCARLLIVDDEAAPYTGSNNYIKRLPDCPQFRHSPSWVQYPRPFAERII
jgi:hypothetical protein